MQIPHRFFLNCCSRRLLAARAPFGGNKLTEMRALDGDGATCRDDDLWRVVDMQSAKIHLANWGFRSIYY